MAKQVEAAEYFAALHCTDTPLVLPNAWDIGSAKAIEKSGAKAIATSSWAVAQANGYDDGENVPLALVVNNVRRIAETVNCPVSVDIETGYGQTPKEVAHAIEQLIQAGAVGVNLEDQNLHAGGELYSIQEQTERLRYARQAADMLSVPLFINARTDVFFQNSDSGDKQTMLNEVLQRVHAYKEVGANGVFVPGLTDRGCIKTLCEQSPLPVNIMLSDFESEAITHYHKLGVARVSTGPLMYTYTMTYVGDLSKRLLNT